MQVPVAGAALPSGFSFEKADSADRRVRRRMPGRRRAARDGVRQSTGAPHAYVVGFLHVPAPARRAP